MIKEIGSSSENYLELFQYHLDQLTAIPGEVRVQIFRSIMKECF